MFLTNTLLKKAKSKYVMVMIESLATGHRITYNRERLADKVEMIRFDPFIQRECLYREVKKIRSFKK